MNEEDPRESRNSCPNNFQRPASVPPIRRRAVKRPLLVALMVVVSGTARAAQPPQTWNNLRCLTDASQNSRPRQSNAHRWSPHSSVNSSRVTSSFIWRWSHRRQTTSSTPRRRSWRGGAEFASFSCRWMLTSPCRSNRSPCSGTSSAMPSKWHGRRRCTTSRVSADSTGQSGRSGGRVTSRRPMRRRQSGASGTRCCGAGRGTAEPSRQTPRLQ